MQFKGRLVYWLQLIQVPTNWYKCQQALKFNLIQLFYRTSQQYFRLVLALDTEKGLRIVLSKILLPHSFQMVLAVLLNQL